VAIHVRFWIAAPHKKRGARNDTQNVSAGIQSDLLPFFKKVKREIDVRAYPREVRNSFMWGERDLVLHKAKD